MRSTKGRRYTTHETLYINRLPTIPRMSRSARASSLTSSAARSLYKTALQMTRANMVIDASNAAFENGEIAFNRVCVNDRLGRILVELLAAAITRGATGGLSIKMHDKITALAVEAYRKENPDWFKTGTDFRVGQREIRIEKALRIVARPRHCRRQPRARKDA
jgi:hypothetical protein